MSAGAGNGGKGRQTYVFDGIDVLTIGGGIAATFAVIKAREAGAPRVVQVDKGYVGKTGNSCFAAGVIHVCFPGEDDFDDRLRRLTRSLGFLAQQDLIQDHLEESFPNLEDMSRYGVEFVRNADGRYERLAGRGSYPVVLFYSTQLMDALRKKALELGVEQVNRVCVTDLLTRDGRVVGAVGFHSQTGDWYVFKAKTTIIATGSTWYKGLCPGQRDCAGDGFGLAYRAGATLSGAEHNDMPANAMPARFDIGPGMNKWVGEGGIFLNRRGERFMEKYSPKLKERSGLPLLTAFLAMEARLGNTPVYMDLTHLGPENMDRLYEVLPLPMRMFESVGLVQDGRFVKPIEWSSCGPVGRPGIVVNRRFEATLPGLLACGEAAAPQAVVTGLAAAGTSGAKAGAVAAGLAREMDPPRVDEALALALEEAAYRPMDRTSGVEPDQIILGLQEAIFPYDVLLMREESRMRRALARVQRIRDEELPLLCAYDPHYLRIAHEAMSLLLTAELHLQAAIQRTETRVALREDYPCVDNVNWLKWLMVRREDGGERWLTEDVPIERYPLQVPREKFLAYPWKVAQEVGILTFDGERVRWA